MPRIDPRNEREAHEALAASIPARSRITERQAIQIAAAGMARHRRFRRALALALWFAFLASLGASLALWFTF